jgi:hypothetical protein
MSSSSVATRLDHPTPRRPCERQQPCRTPATAGMAADSARRAVAAIIATAALALLAAACGGSKGGQAAQLGSTATQSSTSSNTSAASAQENGALAFARCMRSNGVPNYPDPSSGGELVKKTPQQLGVSTSQFQAARRACQHLLPNGGQTHAQYVQQLRARTLRLARCMRAHGVTNFPDPGSDGHFPDAQLHALENQDSPQFQAANNACEKIVPGPGQGGS